MAERTIKAKFQIEGEQAYKTAVQGIISEMNKYRSAIDLINTRFAAHGVTLIELKKKHTAILGEINAQKEALALEETAIGNCQTAIENFKKQATEAKEELDKLTSGKTGLSPDSEAFKKKVTDLEATIARYEGYAQRAATVQNGHATKANAAREELVKLNVALSESTSNIADAEKKVDKTADAVEGYTEKIIRTEDESKKLDGTSQGWVETMKGFLTSRLVEQGFQKLVQFLKDTADASITFESAMAGVRKTTDMSDFELEEMAAAFKELATQIPMSAKEIAGLAEVGGQLGIAKKNLLEFTTVMAALDVSTDLGGEAAAMALAQFANIMGSSQDDFDRMGSTIVALGNNLATTESRITEMAQRLAGAGATLGLTEAQVFAMAGSLSSLGIEAQMGGSAFSKLLKQFEMMVETGSNKLPQFAKVANMSEKEFAAAWRDDAVSVVMAFLEGLDQIDQRGGSSIAILDSLELKEIRLSDTLIRSKNATELYAMAIELANTAWAENTALATEAGLRYETTASQLAMTANAWENMQIALGDKLTPALRDGASIAQGYLNVVTQMIEGNKSLSDWVNLSKEAFDKEKSSIDSTANSAYFYVQELEKMGGAAGRTEQEQVKWSVTVRELISQIPSLSGLINMQTGEIEGGTAAINEQIRKWRLLAIEQAEQERIINNGYAYMATQEALADAELKLQSYKNALENLEWYESFDILVYKRKIEEYERTVANLRRELTDHAGDYEEYKQYLQEIGDTTGEATAETDGLTQAQREMIASQADQIRGIENLKERLQELSEAQTEAKDAAREQVDNVISGFREMEPVAAASIEDMIAALQTQVDYMNDYSEYLQKAMDAGVNIGMVQQLNDGTASSLALIKAFVNATPEEIERLNNAFADVATAKDTMATNMAEINTNFSTTMDELTADYEAFVAALDQSTTAFSAGEGTIDSVTEGIRSGFSDLQAALNEAGSMLNRLKAQSYVHGGSQNVGAGHAAGLSYVPYDEYAANLHEGEMVLTRLQAEAYRASERTAYGMAGMAGNVNNDNRQISITVQMTGTDGVDGRRLARELQRELRYRGVI